MPLKPGKSNIGHNIAELEDSGHPHDQAVAIALHESDKTSHERQANLRLPDLNDDEKFVKIPDVAILDEDQDEDPNLTPEFLQKVVQKTNENINAGDLVLVTLGHTEDDKSEEEQPRPIGYINHVELGKLGSKAAVLADVYITRDEYEHALTFPRRSVELWHDDDYQDGSIDLVALLRRAPARQLGLLAANKSGKVTRYSRNSYKGALMSEDDIKRLAEHLARAMRNHEGEDEQEEIDHAEERVKEDIEHDHEKEHRSKKHKVEKNHCEEEDEDHYEASAASGANTFVPGEIDEKKARKMRRDTDRVRLTQLERRLSQVEKERDEVALKLRRSERERDLKQLEAEGFAFDPVEELAFVEQMDDQSYGRHLERARTLYKRLPVGPAPMRLAAPQLKDNKAEVDEIVKYGLRNGIHDFSQAASRYAKESGK